MPKDLEIYWRIQRPPLFPKEWVGINADREVTPEEQLIENSLDFPPGTLAYLETAFAMGLRRQQGWLLEELTTAAVIAAEVFRRGVAWRCGEMTVNTRYPDGRYRIEFAAEDWTLARLKEREEYFYVIDERVAELWPETKELAPSIIVKSHEHEKTLATAAFISGTASQHKTRHWCVLAGGVISDIAAFAAYLKQIKVHFVPTTLLAMADACVGGKTGINFPPFGKNQVGAFSFPHHVTIWPGWLKTLDQRQRNAGLNECLKHALLCQDEDLLQTITACPDQYDWLEDVVKVKADVVAEDPEEKGKRAILNFGHTLAHALEALSHSQVDDDILLHGEAVGVGMLFALHLSTKLGFMEKAESTRLMQMLRGVVCIPDRSTLERHLGSKLDDSLDSLLGYMRQDKKRNSHEDLPFVLLRSRGEPLQEGDSFTHGVSENSIRELWPEFLSGLA